MSLRLFNILVFLGTVVSWIAWAMIVIMTSPADMGALGFMMFYLTLFLALFGSILIVTDWIKAKILKKKLLIFRLRTSLRHAFFFSVFLVGWLFLKSLDLTVWWTVLLFILVLTVLEFFFISFHKQKQYYEGAN